MQIIPAYRILSYAQNLDEFANICYGISKDQEELEQQRLLLQQA
jgi:hypothetical protein